MLALPVRASVSCRTMVTVKFPHLVWLTILALLMMGLQGCDDSPPRKPVPVGDHAALEQLATAYRSVSGDYPIQPASMKPEGKKEFVERVFATAGYHYGATLSTFAKQGVDVTSQDQRDLTDLLFLPHRGLSDADMQELYTDEELAAILTIQASLK